MKNKILLIGFLLSVNAFADAQTYDTVSLAYDTTGYADAYVDTVSYENGDLEAVYNIENPSQLPVTQANNLTEETKHDFDKKEWKELVGETNYTEEKQKEAAQEKNSPVSEPSPVWSPQFFKYLGFGLLFAIAIVVLYFLVKNTFADDFRDKKINDADSLLNYDQHIDDVNEQDIESLLKRALSNKDFRGAIRLYYIRLLKHLHSTNYISWKKDKTNRDYSSELSATPFVGDFRKITLAYEIVWYGERTPSSLEFERLQKNFDELHGKTSQRTPA